MVEVIWHARGGQGAFTAARALGAAAALSAGVHALAFPTFGPERRGAPMCAYTKISDAPIGDRSAVRQADVVAYLDETLIQDGWEAELAPGGILLLNAAHPAKDPRIICVDADAISAEVLGRPIPNTALLGAIAALSDAVTLEDVHEGIRATMPARLQEKNLRIADAGFEYALEALKAQGSERVQGGACESRASVRESVAIPGSESAQGADVRQGTRFTPYLRETFEVPPEAFARTTCFEAGHLVSENAGWRSVRPLIQESLCARCLNCHRFCPDGTIFTVRNGSGEVERVVVDYAFCKGCGVCAQVCPVDCIAMVSERGEEERA